MLAAQSHCRGQLHLASIHPGWRSIELGRAKRHQSPVNAPGHGSKPLNPARKAVLTALLGSIPY